MTSQAQVRNSPYLIAFMLAAMMVWSFSAITRSMDGALQQTHVELRAPIADLGTAIQDSAIALRHRLKPQAPAALPSQPSRPTSITSDQPSPTPPPIPEAFTPVSVPEVTALNELLASSTPGRGKAKGSSGRGKKTQTWHSSAVGADVLGPPTPATGSHPGKGKGPKRPAR